MKIFKLDAINSTSTYLKQLSKETDVDNWTVVSAEYQTLGRGQVETKWISEKGKNLLFSILIKYESLKIQNHFYLNCAISLGIYFALLKFQLPKLMIKWPNDIMADNKKLGGILIENSLRNDRIYQSIVGIGLNVNQKDFSEYPFKAVSIKNLTGTKIERDTLLHELINSIRVQINFLKNGEFDLLHKKYKEVLFRINKPHMFESNGKIFIGKIIGVSESGKLQIEDELENRLEFNFKEVKYL